MTVRDARRQRTASACAMQGLGEARFTPIRQQASSAAAAPDPASQLGGLRVRPAPGQARSRLEAASAQRCAGGDAMA